MPSSEMQNPFKFSGGIPANLPEKPSFSHTCSLLSQYLKEKGTFGDLNLGGMPEIFQHSATPMNLFPISEKPGDASASRNPKAMDLLGGFVSPKEDAPKTVASSPSMTASEEPKAAQMTIFYGGRVIVFDDFPAEKAKEIMVLASKGSSQMFATESINNPTGSGPRVPTKSAVVPAWHAGPNSVQESAPRPAEPIATGNLSAKSGITADLPIARRNSLHRFLEKRKDRVTARSPYAPPAEPSKPAENFWLSLSS